MKSALILLALTVSAHATETSIDIRHQSPGRTTCTVVREFVAMVGAAEAERMARAAGASDARLAAAKRCLK